MFKKLISLVLAGLLICSPVYAGSKNLAIIDNFKGLDRSLSDKTEVGSHVRFENVYVKNGNLQSVKGRNRLNSTALSNTTSNGFWYYENAAGTTKKLVRFENTILASYDVDGTNRTELNTGLTNEKHDAVQIGDTLYISSDTDGLYKWTGSGAATAISGVSAPSAVDFAATTGDGAMTPGQDILLTLNTTFDSTCNTNCDGTTAVVNACTFVTGSDFSGDGVTADTGTLETAHTTTTYSYKVTKYSNTWGIESEASTADTAALKGDDTFTWVATGCVPCDDDSTDVTCDNLCCSGTEYVSTGKQTRTTGTLAATPAAPFDGYCVYRTPAGSTDYFRHTCVRGGGTAFNDGKADSALDPNHPLDESIDTINPPSYRYIDEFKGSIFLAQSDTISFNRLSVQAASDADNYWLDSDEFTTGSKKPITGLHKTSDSLLVFTSATIQELTGFGYSSFKLKPFAEGIGAVSDEAIETDVQGDVIFFAGTEGVYKIKTFSQLQDDSNGTAISNQARVRLTKISSPVLDEVFKGTDSLIDLDPSDYTTAHAYYDKDNNLYFLYIGQHSFLYDNANNIWSYLPATKMGASVYRKSPNSAGQGVLIDTVGFMFNNWLGYENGIESGSVTGAITASGNTTLTCGACTFNTTNDGLKGLWVALIGDDDEIEYRQIASNTGTQITVSTAWTTNPITTDTFYVAYIIPDFTSKIYSLDKPPKRSAITDFYITNELAASSQTLYFYSFEDKATEANNAKSYDLSAKRIYESNFPINALWMQLRMRTYIYATSETISSPLNIISYIFRGEVLEE